MDKRLNKSVHWWVFVSPVMVLLFVFLISGIIIYQTNYLPVKDLSKLRIENLVSEKKRAFSILLDHYVYVHSFMSGNIQLRDDIAILINSDVPLKKRVDETMKLSQKSIPIIKGTEVGMSEAITIKTMPPKRLIDAQRRLSKFFEDMQSVIDHRMFAIISTDGNIVFSNRKELIGDSLAEKDFFRNIVPSLKQVAFAGFSDFDDFYRGMIFLTPIFNPEGNMIAVICTIISEDRFASLLKTEYGFYRTENVEIVDSNGKVVLTDKGITINKSENQEGLISYAADIDNIPFRIVASIKKSEITNPFYSVILFYLSFAGFILIVIVIQSRLISLLLKNNYIENISSTNAVGLYEIFSDIELYSKKLIGSKDVELIFDCDEVFHKRLVQVDKNYLYQILKNILNISLRTTDTGTITVLSSLVKGNGSEFIEISISDTGKGLEGVTELTLSEITDDVINLIVSYASPAISSELIVAKNLTDVIGGSIEIEHIPHKGLLTVLKIPLSDVRR